MVSRYSSRSRAGASLSEGGLGAPPTADPTQVSLGAVQEARELEVQGVQALERSIMERSHILHLTNLSGHSQHNS